MTEFSDVACFALADRVTDFVFADSAVDAGQGFAFVDVRLAEVSGEA
jgi:hypothetical protein